MQQTKLDRWLREKYAYITHVYCNTKPASIPDNVESKELNAESGVPFRYQLSSIHSSAISGLVKQLESENITYTSRVADRQRWYSRWINNPKKSFSYRVFWVALLFAGLLFAVSPVPRLAWQYLSEDAVETPVDKKKEPSMQEKLAERRDKLGVF